MTDRVQQAKDLLIEQYKNSPNLNGLISAHTEQMQAIDTENENLLNKRGLDTAEGENLNNIGRIVVLDRPFTDPDPEEVFTFENPSDIGGGYTDENGVTQGGYYIGLDPIDNQQYSDRLYRLILRAKIIFNTTDATLQQMYDFSQFVFGVESVILERVGAIDVNIARPIGRQEKEILRATFPLPAGVRLGTLSTSTQENAFGFAGNASNGGFSSLAAPSEGGVFSSLVID